MNGEIRAKEVRVIDETGAQLGVLSLADALKRAEASGLELVEVSPQADPPVCRIIDYGKFKYKQEKMAKDAKKKQRVILSKEVRMRPFIEEHDYQVKMKSVMRFLEHGDRVKVTVMFRGRELEHQEVGRQLMDRLVKDVETVGEVEKLPGLEGRNMVAHLMASKKGKKTHAESEDK